MTALRRQFLLYLFVLSDLGLLGLSLYVAVSQREAIASLSSLVSRRVQVHTIIAMLVLFCMWRMAFSLMGLYRSKRLDKQSAEHVEMMTASAVATMLLAIVALSFQVRMITPGVLLRFLCLTAFGLIASRLLMRQALKAVRLRGRNLRHLVVIGSNHRAVAFANSCLARPELGYRLVGFVDDVWVGSPPQDSLPATLVANLAGFRSFVRHHVVDEVVIALPIKSFYDQEREVLQVCREQGLIVRILSDLFTTSPASVGLDELGSTPVVSFYTVPSDALQLGAKRLFDIVGSILLLFLFSPIMLAAFVLVKLDSRGPAIFIQDRVGLNKRTFRIFKFRSMVTNAEQLQGQLESGNEAEGPVFKIKKDPRITRSGRFLRKTSIDELPQLFNVLKGDMSLVGPRPLPVRDYTGFNEDWQRRRFSVRPGITCLWQISGRSGVSFDQWMRLDMEYIDRWSLWLDMTILARTIPAVMKGTGAA